jgi:hypothetical protein
LKDYVFGDIHLSVEGNAIVADVVGKSLEETPAVKRLHPGR